jgi:hypothetical protein
MLPDCDKTGAAVQRSNEFRICAEGAALDYWWSMTFSEKRYPSRIRTGAGFFRIMR